MFNRKPKRAAVLGCGPAGLFAAHALMERGWSISIFSNKRRSEMYGAQYLHKPIPGLTESAPVKIDYRLIGGTEENYRAKVYGDRVVRTSVRELAGSHLGWDIREAYYNAWNRYAPIISDIVVTPEILGVMPKDFSTMSPIRIDWSPFRVVVNSIPLPRLCFKPELHRFVSEKVWAIGDAPERGIYAPYRAKPNTVECNASRDVGWYRASNVFNYTTVEWPGRTKPPLHGVAEVEKPIGTSCKCYQVEESWPWGEFVNVGRYGSWTKGVLSHHAYEMAASL